ERTVGSDREHALVAGVAGIGRGADIEQVGVGGAGAAREVGLQEAPGLHLQAGVGGVGLEVPAVGEGVLQFQHRLVVVAVPAVP
nr:hypothetical protein [Tanacetum cinerariifolium]